MVCPRKITQPGIAEELGLTRACVAKELIRLRGKGLIEAETAYINGAKRQMKVFFLSLKGEQLAAQFVDAWNWKAVPRPSDRAARSTPAKGERDAVTLIRIGQGVSP